MKTQVNSPSFFGTPRAVISEDGYLTFNHSASQLLNLDFQRHMRVSVQEGNDDGSIIYLIPDKYTPKATFKVGRSKDGYYINLKRYFQSFNLDYHDTIITYSFRTIMYEGNRIWMLRKTTIPLEETGSISHTTLPFIVTKVDLKIRKVPFI